MNEEPTTKSEFEKAEYEALRREMLQHMQSEIQLTSFGLIFTSSILGLLITASSQNFVPESLLLPLPVLWFSIYAVIEHHRQVVTIGTYLHQFLESQDRGLHWEHRLSIFRGRTNNMLWRPFHFHGFVWFLHTVLAALCVTTAVIRSPSPVSPWIVLAGISASLVILHTLILVIALERPKFDKVWQQIQDEEQPSKVGQSESQSK